MGTINQQFHRCKGGKRALDDFKFFMEENGVLIFCIVVGTVIGHVIAWLIGL